MFFFFLVECASYFYISKNDEYFSMFCHSYSGNDCFYNFTCFCPFSVLKCIA